MVNKTSSTLVISKSAVVVSPTIVPLLGLLKVSVAVSVDSNSVSVKIGTLIVPDVSPALMVKVADCAV